MAIKPIDLKSFHEQGMNIHESIVVASKRARQVNDELKIEFNQRVELITTKTETEGEEIDINPDQLKISLEFEHRAKPTDVALAELLERKLAWRYKEKEEIETEVEEEETPAEAEEE